MSLRESIHTPEPATTPTYGRMPDVQSRPDPRRIAIDQVGIRGLKHPIRVRGGDGAIHHAVGTFQMTVGLPQTSKGTHMSRFVELLRDAEPFSVDGFEPFLRAMLSRLDAATGRLEIRFTHFLEKRAPVSGTPSLLDIEAEFSGEIGPNGQYRFSLEIQAPVTSLCPCSKEISDRGAHNQRSVVSIRAELSQPVTIEELATIAQEEGSCEVYGVLKRPDEKWVTERAYDNPKFVEDLVRDVAGRLAKDRRIRGFQVDIENFESIHNHSAYARISRPASETPGRSAGT